MLHRFDSRHRASIHISALSSLLFSSSSVVFFPLAPLSSLFTLTSSLSSFVVVSPSLRQSLSLSFARCLLSLSLSLFNHSPLSVFALFCLISPLSIDCFSAVDSRMIYLFLLSFVSSSAFSQCVFAVVCLSMWLAFCVWVVGGVVWRCGRIWRGRKTNTKKTKLYLKILIYSQWQKRIGESK